MKLALRLLKEFWVAAVVATAWTAYNIHTADAVWNIKNFITIFGPSFFLASWATGQYFRVKKQTNVEDSFGTMEMRLEKLLSEIERTTNQMIGHISGGNGFCYLSINSNNHQNPNIISMMIVHKGEHPLHNVKAKIIDSEKFHQNAPPSPDFHKLNQAQAQAFFREFDQALENATTYLNFDIIIPNHVVTVGEWDLGTSKSKDFNIFWTARNGAYQQKLKLNRELFGWSMETKVIQDRVISEPGFVLDPANQEERYLVLYQSNFR